MMMDNMMEDNKMMMMDDEEENKKLVDSKMGDVDEKEDEDEPETCPEKYEGEQIIWDLNRL